MKRLDADALGERLSAALDAWAFGVELTAERFRHERPHDSAEDVDERIQQWLCSRPLDGVGRRLQLPRS